MIPTPRPGGFHLQLSEGGLFRLFQFCDPWFCLLADREPLFVFQSWKTSTSAESHSPAWRLCISSLRPRRQVPLPEELWLRLHVLAWHLWRRVSDVSRLSAHLTHCSDEACSPQTGKEGCGVERECVKLSETPPLSRRPGPGQSNFPLLHSFSREEIHCV